MKLKKKILALTTNLVALVASLAMIGCQADTPTVDSSSVRPLLPYYQEATFTPQWLNRVPDSDIFHHIGAFRLTNQEGVTITEQTFRNKIYVTDFFFTFCPGICPKMTTNMLVLQDSFLADEDILLLSHSVTPTRDSVPVLKAYAERKGINSKKWHLATGDKTAIYNLGRTRYFVEEDLGLEKEEDAFLHTENFVLIDKNGFIRGIYNGLNNTAVQQLIKDVRTLQAEQP